MEQLIYLILLFPTFPQRDWPLPKAALFVEC